MKKFLSLLGGLCLALSLFACGGKPPTPSVAPSVEPSLQESIAPSVEQSANPSVEVSVTPSAENLLSLVTFPSRTVRYNGARQALALKNLPEGAEVTFSVNEQTTAADNLDAYDLALGAAKPGVYGVTATVTLGGAKVTLSAVLTINKARLSVTAEDKRIDLYAPFPQFTYTLSGLVEGDVFAPVGGEEDAPQEETDSSLLSEENPSSLATFTGNLSFTCSAEKYSPVGVYDVLPYGVESDCYEISFKKGRLFIEDYDTDLIVGGLKQNGESKMTYNGKEINWQGVNYFGVWQNVFNFKTGEPNEDLVQASFLGLEELASYNVKVIRFAASFFYEDWWQKCFFQSEEHKLATIYTMHRIFNKAAELNILLVPSVFWNNRLMNYYKEDFNYAWGNPESQTWQFVMEYQTLLLDHFNSHPALGFWEFGNEWSLKVDVNGPEGYQSNLLHDVRLAWANLIASRNQTYRRVIGSGDGGLRASQYNKFTNGSWTEDTLEQNAKYLAYINEGITATSNHIYERPPLIDLTALLWKNATLQQQMKTEYGLTEETFTAALRKDYAENPEKYAGAGGLFEKYGTSGDYSLWLGGITTLKEMIEHYIAASRVFGATFYVGELGLSYTYGETVLHHGELANGYGYYADLSYDDIRSFSRTWNELQTQTGLSLALYWNYEYDAVISNVNGVENGRWDDKGSGTEYSFSTNWEKGRICLAALKEHNDAWDVQNA